MTHHRQGKERVYEFLDKVAPRNVRHPATVSEAEDFFARKAIALRGMVTGRVFRKMWSGFIQRPVGTDEGSRKLRDLVEEKSAAEVKINGRKGSYFLLRSDLPALLSLQDGELPNDWTPTETTTEDEVIFLSPLEYVSARGRARELFGFEYVWEIYKPAAHRRWGPYTMPILYRDRLVARMDARLDREKAILRINGFWLEEGEEADEAFAGALAAGLIRCRRFLGVSNIDAAALESQIPKKISPKGCLRGGSLMGCLAGSRWPYPRFIGVRVHPASSRLRIIFNSCRVSLGIMPVCLTARQSRPGQPAC